MRPDLLLMVGLGPIASTFLDSGDPFCTSHTVSMTNRKNCRYSDCQFSATFTANAEDAT